MNPGDTTYVSAVKMNEIIAMTEKGLRDLSSPDLSPFWAGVPAVSQEETTASFQESQAFRIESSLPPNSESSFAMQASKGGAQETFMNYLAEMGLEKAYVEDVTEEAVEEILPDVEGLSEVIQTLEVKGFKADIAGLAARFKGVTIPIEKQTIKHLSEPLPSSWADESSIVARRLARARTYLNLYLGEV